MIVYSQSNHHHGSNLNSTLPNTVNEAYVHVFDVASL